VPVHVHAVSLGVAPCPTPFMGTTIACLCMSMLSALVLPLAQRTTGSLAISSVRVHATTRCSGDNHRVPAHVHAFSIGVGRGNAL
jgi:hypothetical protein